MTRTATRPIASDRNGMLEPGAQAHCKRVAAWCEELALVLDIPGSDASALQEAALMHHHPIGFLRSSGVLEARGRTRVCRRRGRPMRRGSFPRMPSRSSSHSVASGTDWPASGLTILLTSWISRIHSMSNSNTRRTRPTHSKRSYSTRSSGMSRRTALCSSFCGTCARLGGATSPV